MGIVTWNDIYLAKQQANVPFINGGMEKPYLQEYSKLYTEIDFIANKKYSDLIYDKTEKPINDILNDITVLIRGILTWNDYKYSKMYNTMVLEYNPLNNYNERYERTIEGTHTNTKNGNIQESTEGNKTNIRTGSVDNTDIIGTSITTNTNVSTYDSNNKPRETVTTTPSGSDTSKTIYNNVKDENVVGNVKSTMFTNVADVESWNGYKEVIVQDGCSRGDTSQHLIEEERRIALFSFYSTLFDDIANTIFMGVWYNED